MQEMDKRNVVQWTGWFGVVAGVLLTGAEIVLTFFVPTGGEVQITPAFRLSSALFFSGAIALVPGVVGIYLYQEHKLGKFGLIAFLLTLMGSAMMIASDFDELFVAPIFVTLGYTEAPAELIVGFLMNYGIYALGWILFAIASFRAGVFNRVACAMLVVGPLLALTQIPAIFMPTYLAIIWLSFTVAGQREAKVSAAPAPAA
jgi:hypothetical protein